MWYDFLIRILKIIINKGHKRVSHTNDLFFLPLGGSGEIGMNLNLYGYKNKWLMVDCGITFTHELGLDVLMPDISFIEAHRKDLLGIVLTHGHEDHIGALPYLWHRLNVPLYATPFTAHLIREKLKESGHLKEEFIKEIPLGSSVNIDPFKIKMITLTHSIPEPNAIAIQTPRGTVVHTGDWKIDPIPLIGHATDIKELKRLGDEGVLALVCDSTNALLEGRSGSESTVRQELIHRIKKTEGRVIVSCFASNIARLSSIMIAAQEAGRRVALFGRSLFRMEEAARREGYLKNLDPFLHEKDLKRYDPEELVIICTGSQGEPRSALSRMAHGTHPHVQLNDQDTVIFSSRKIPGNEVLIKNLHEKLLARGVTIIQDEKDSIHVSGHPAREELRDMYAWIRPQILIPVHGEGHHMRAQAELAQACGIPHTFVPSNGSMIALDPERLGVVEKVTNGRWAVDGTTLVPRQDIHLKERTKLMETGVVSVFLHLTKNKQVKTIDILFFGVSEMSLQDKLKQRIEQALYQELFDPKATDTHLKETVRLSVRRSVMALKGRKPQVMVHIH